MMPAPSINTFLSGTARVAAAPGERRLGHAAPGQRQIGLGDAAMPGHADDKR